MGINLLLFSQKPRPDDLSGNTQHQQSAMASLWRDLLFKTMACTLHTNADEIERVSTVIPQRADFNEIIMVVNVRALAAQTTFDPWVTTTRIKSFVCLQQPDALCTAHLSITWEQTLLAAGWAWFQQRSITLPRYVFNSN